jgi:hypothetical protein
MYTTHHKLAFSMAVNLVGYVDGATSVLCNGDLSFLGRLELPDGVLILWVLLQFFGCHRRHCNKNADDARYNMD